jgi:hypothetical protein
LRLRRQRTSRRSLYSRRQAATPASSASCRSGSRDRLEPRLRKEKADIAAPRPVAASRGRRVASRIAAGIVALIAAAGALVMADREAFGGPYVLPWVSPLPPYQMPWSLFGQHKRAEAAGTGIYAVDGQRPARPCSHAIARSGR